MNGPFPQFGSWVKLPTPETVELLAAAEFDFVVIDNEHGAIDIRTTSTMIGLARACGIEPWVRVAGTTPRDVQIPLDAGAAGLLVPQIDDVAQAHAAVRATRFPPLGRRGASTSGRAGQWGLRPLVDYLKNGNDDVRLVVQAESTAALASIVQLGTVRGVDGVFIGPTDLAVSSGLHQGHDWTAEIIRVAADQCTEHGIPVGTTVSGNGSELLQQRGYDFVVLGADTTILRQGGHALVTAARASLAVP